MNTKKEKPYNVTVKFLFSPGNANPGPPIAPVFGQYGVNIPEVCKKLNAETAKDKGKNSMFLAKAYINSKKKVVVGYKICGIPTSHLIKELCSLTKGSSTPGHEDEKKKFYEISRSKLMEIAKYKLANSNAYDLKKVLNSIVGTARSMGISVIDD